jgi:hypothetical protein
MYGHWPKYNISGTPFPIFPVELWETSCQSVHFLLTDFIKKEQSMDEWIILLFNSKHFTDGLIW